MCVRSHRQSALAGEVMHSQIFAHSLLDGGTELGLMFLMLI